MSRRVRHVHARPGQHVVVHRHDRPRRRFAPAPIPPPSNPEIPWCWIIGGGILALVLL